jgi:hypothetical protein
MWLVNHACMTSGGGCKSRKADKRLKVRQEGLKKG